MKGEYGDIIMMKENSLDKSIEIISIRVKEKLEMFYPTKNTLYINKGKLIMAGEVSKNGINDFDNLVMKYTIKSKDRIYNSCVEKG